MHLPSQITHPIMALAIVVGSCLLAREFYPLNNFPMYADPGPEPSVFAILTDGENNLVDIRPLTGETSAKVNKKYVDRRNELATAAGIKQADQATPEICEKAWQEVAARLDKLARKRKKTLPGTLTLTIGELYQENGAFRESTKMIGSATIWPATPKAKSEVSP